MFALTHGDYYPYEGGTTEVIAVSESVDRLKELAQSHTENGEPIVWAEASDGSWSAADPDYAGKYPDGEWDIAEIKVV